MPEFYHTVLENELSRRDLTFLEILVCQLQIYTTVTLEGLAARLPLPILLESRRRRIQRFLNLEAARVQQLWFALLRVILPKVIRRGERVYLALDRTQWQSRNLFFISLVTDGRAYPLCWHLLSKDGESQDDIPKEGASNLREQQALVLPVLDWFSHHYPVEIVVLGDR